MPIEIKEIIVRTTVIESNNQVAALPELIRKLKRELREELKLQLEQNEKRKRER